jgi:hypothetical protein
LDANASKSFQFRTLPICSISHPKRRANNAVFILSVSENIIRLSFDAIPILLSMRNPRSDLATSELLTPDKYLNLFRVLDPEIAGIAFKTSSGCSKENQQSGLLKYYDLPLVKFSSVKRALR